MNTLVTTTITAINDSQPEPQSTDADAPLLAGSLDSLGLVELLVRLEQAVEERYGAAPKLIGNPDVICEGGPLDTVGSLVSYLEGTVG